MRELEFLPSWYPQWQQRRRLLFLQVWVSIALALGLGLWIFLADRNRCGAEEALATIKGQWQQTNAQLQQMERLEVLGKQWRQQAEVINRLGLHVKSSLLMSRLAAVMPPGVSLLSLDCAVEEVPLSPSSNTQPGQKVPAAPPVDRRLRVKLLGVAPTDVELATFVIELNKVPFFDRVTPTYARDRREAGHILREFELTFSINLNLPTGN